MIPCKRCGGPTTGQNTWEGAHRHNSDCIRFLKSALARIHSLLSRELAEVGTQHTGMLENAAHIAAQIPQDEPDAPPETRP